MVSLKTCSIVIGSLWGDEGKGHMTSKLCKSQKSLLNVRFNGGAQAGHTAINADGKRHAFGHFGSGTFEGAATYLTEDFIVNPVAFGMELAKLNESFGIHPKVYVNPDAIVTTPFDMFLNQALEICRGAERHGSCGYGINETVVRSKVSEFRITVEDLLDTISTREKFKKIRTEYVPQRLKDELGITVDKLPHEYQLAFDDEDNWERFKFFINTFLDNVRRYDDTILEYFDNIVFEGAQGLLLDQNRKEYFPNITTSNTGIKNVLKVLEHACYTGDFSIYYMSRCYFTRHGAGRLPGELNEKPYEKIEDQTNMPNQFQGTLRFATLNFDILADAVNQDLQNLESCAAKPNVYVAFTCLDQLDETFSYVHKTMKSAPSASFYDIAQKILSNNLSKCDGIITLTYDDQVF